MIFYNYGHGIPRDPVLYSFMQALRDAFAAHRTQGNIHMGTADHQYRSNTDVGDVVLSLAPSRSMTWRDWRVGLIGLNYLVHAYDTVEFMFSMKKRGEDIVIGLGYLAYTRS